MYYLSVKIYRAFGCKIKGKFNILVVGEVHIIQDKKWKDLGVYERKAIEELKVKNNRKPEFIMASLRRTRTPKQMPSLICAMDQKCKLYKRTFTYFETDYLRRTQKHYGCSEKLTRK